MGNNAIQALEMITGMQEQMIDAEIHKLDNLKGDDLAKIREERMRSMKDRKAEEAEWSRNGHGHLQGGNQTTQCLQGAFPLCAA